MIYISQFDFSLLLQSNVIEFKRLGIAFELHIVFIAISVFNSWKMIRNSVGNRLIISV